MSAPQVTVDAVSNTVRVASVNVNGIRAAVRNGMAGWLDHADVDILTLQEVRAGEADLLASLPGWHVVADEASAKGRAGVAIAAREPLDVWRVEHGADDFDTAGRWIEADVPVGDSVLTVVSAYVHTGEAETPKQEAKYAFLDAMEARLPVLAADGAYALVTGDLNVGHRELDIRNWRGNRKKAGFLPRERAYFDRFLGETGASVTGVDESTGPGLGWIDVGRQVHGEVDGPYTWWSSRGKAFDTDTGWRIDYHLASPALAGRFSGYHIARASAWDTRWSDHAPVVADYLLG